MDGGDNVNKYDFFELDLNSINCTWIICLLSPPVFYQHQQHQHTLYQVIADTTSPPHDVHHHSNGNADEGGDLLALKGAFLPLPPPQEVNKFY